MTKTVIEPRLASRYRDHRAIWKNCSRCGLCKERTNTALFRGTLPCNILFLGEAPGESEDILGYPFVGPAGKLLDKLIADAQRRAEHLPTYGITNIVACFPQVDRIIRQPTEQEVAACRPRLVEIIHLSKCKQIVTLGQIAKKYLPTVHLVGRTISALVHPAAILRNGDVSTEPDSPLTLEEKRFSVNLARIFQGDLVCAQNSFEKVKYAV